MVQLTEHERMRRELWCNAWTATAKSSNCVKYSTCTTYADEALKEFDRRFNSPEEMLDAKG